jgi:uncharacterized DUF497 family protein
MSLGFEWDLNKASANLSKHGVSFSKAASVFADPLSLTVADDTHSVEESRFFTIGVSNRGRLLSVFYTDRDARVRIISARPATKRERTQYEESD